MSNNEEWIKAHDAHLGAFLAYMETPLPPLRMCLNPEHLHDWASGPECLACDDAQNSQQSQSQPITERIQRHIAEGPAREQLALRMAYVDKVMRGYSGIIDTNGTAYQAWTEWMARRTQSRMGQKVTWERQTSRHAASFDVTKSPTLSKCSANSYSG